MGDRRERDALAVARANIAGCAATRVRTLEGSWFDALPHELRGRLELIVSNPPYVAEHEVPDLPDEVARFEPHGALVVGPTGSEALEYLLAHAREWLVPARFARVRAGAAPGRRDGRTSRWRWPTPRCSCAPISPGVRVCSWRVLGSVLRSVPDDELDVDAMLERFRDRAAAVEHRPLPPVAGEERMRFIEQAQIDFQDFAIIGDATWTFVDGVLTLTVDLRRR